MFSFGLRTESHIRRVWGIGRIHVSKVLPEPQGSGCGTAPHFFVFSSLGARRTIDRSMYEVNLTNYLVAAAAMNMRPISINNIRVSIQGNRADVYLYSEKCMELDKDRFLLILDGNTRASRKSCRLFNCFLSIFSEGQVMSISGVWYYAPVTNKKKREMFSNMKLELPIRSWDGDQQIQECVKVRTIKKNSNSQEGEIADIGKPFSGWSIKQDTILIELLGEHMGQPIPEDKVKEISTRISSFLSDEERFSKKLQIESILGWHLSPEECAKYGRELSKRTSRSKLGITKELERLFDHIPMPENRNPL